MKFHIPTSICPMLAIFLLMLMPHTVLADYDYFSDRISREHRDAGDVEDWIERGNATVTASPRFDNGIRLTAWAGETDEAENYEFAIASAIYLFEIPRQVQYVEILVRYRGEPHRADFDYEEIAGRVWIRNTKREYARRHYSDNGEEEETLYGDTFFLRAKRRSETIKIATAGRVDNGMLEMHIVAENGEQLDVEYVDVVTYQRQPDVRVIHRYARDYHWQPWHRYTYLYFYDGPFYYCTDLGYYIRWSYPVYDHHYLAIRRAYGSYLHGYYRRYPRYYHRNSYYRVNVQVESPKTRRLNRWTSTHENTRREYSRSRLSITKSKTNTTPVQTRVRSLITEHRQTPVLTDRVIQRSTLSQKRRLPDTRNGLNTATEQQRTVRSSPSDFSTRSYRATQQILKRKRLSSVERDSRSSKDSRFDAEPRTRVYDWFRFSTKDNRTSNDNEISTRSNAERRVRLYNRTQPSKKPLSTPSSRGRSSSVKKSKETRARFTQSRSRSSATAAPRVQKPTTQQKSSSASSTDDDDEKQQRSRSTTRTQTRSRRK